MSLNSKKSWHPGKAINRAKVAKLKEDEENKAKELASRTKQLEDERKLARLRQEAGGKETSSNKLDWMYTKKQQDKSPNHKPLRLDGGALNVESDSTALDKLNARKAAIDPLAQILSKSKPAKKPQNAIRKSDSRRRKS